MIDSGATDSVINPTPAFEKFSEYIYKHPFTVTGLTTTVCSDDNMMFPLLYEHGINHPIDFRIVKWHDKFDALIGSQDMETLNAKIDYGKNVLEINHVEIPFILEYTSDQINCTPRNFNNHLKVPVTIENGEVIIPQIKLPNNTYTPESIAIAKDGYCILPIDKECNIAFSHRIPVTPLFESEICDPNKIKNPNFSIEDNIRINHLNEEEKHKIVQLCNKYSDIFHQENIPLSSSNTVQHHIRTSTEQPIYVRPYRHPHAMREEITNQIQKLLSNNIIRPSISPYCSPVWLVPKKADASGKIKHRMVIDYRRLNEQTIEDKYPIPRIDEILDSLGKCTYYTTLDLSQGFHQIEMHPDSIEKTAFSVNNGHYEYLRMPFGLKNAPSTFQRAMDSILKEFINKFCLVYMDDIIVFSKSLHDHLIHLRQIFQKLREHNLKVQLDKTEFLQKEVPFLGHIITPQGVRPNPNKISAIQKFPLPTTPKAIKSFLGLIGFYRRFIKNFAKIVSPLTRCLKKDAKIDPTNPEFITAFQHCKELLCNAPILAYPDFTKNFTLTTDASNVAVGGVLSQQNKPIAFYSRTLNTAEKDYATIEKELLAIIECVKHFRPYLYGRHFHIETDHKPLSWLYNFKGNNTRLMRWKLKLEEYNFSVGYKKGKDNVVADALSRVEIQNNETNNEINDNDSVIVNVNEIPEISQDDIDQILGAETPRSVNLDNEADDTDLETVHSGQQDTGLRGPVFTERPVNTFSNRIIIKLSDTIKRRITRPFNKNTHLVTLNKENFNETLKEILTEIISPNRVFGIFLINPELKEPLCNIITNTFNESVKIYISNTYCRDVTEPISQKEIVEEYHDKTHTGITETYNQLKQKYYWPCMQGTITTLINKCEVCLRSKYERNPYNLKFDGPLMAKRPFDIIHIDTFSFQKHKFLTIYDLFSKYAQAYHLPDKNAIAILNCLRNYITHHNIPGKIVADEGTEFKNKTVIEFCKLYKIDLHFTTVNNPSSNSPVERFHSTLTERIRTLLIKNPNETPPELVTGALIIYNQSIHTSTGFSPFHLLYGPYDRNIEYDLDMTVYEHYNEKRRQELLPFYDHVFQKNLTTAQKALEDKNKNRTEPPNLENLEIYVERDRPRKTDPPFQKIVVTGQERNKITGTTDKNRQTTANIRKVKRLRKPCNLQTDTEPQPGTSDNPSQD